MKKLFTMIEIVIVVAILLFLAAGLYVVGTNLFKRYSDMQGKMEFLKIQNGLAAYKSATGEFPPDYMSSSQNENASKSRPGGWIPVYFQFSGEFTTYAAAEDFYNKYSAPDGAPKALVEYVLLGHTKWGVWVWSWGDDIGGEFPATTSSFKKTGYVCQAKKTVQDNIGSIVGYFGKRFPKADNPNEEERPYYYQVIDVKKAKGINVQYCGAPELICGETQVTESMINGETHSCGWHNLKSDVWEGAYDQAESSKALYDFLCRPMKGRMKDGVPVNPKYENAKPFIEVSNKLIREASKAPPFQCDGSPTDGTPVNYKRYGEGLYNLTDSFEIIDVWGERYLYVSSASEYTVASDNKVPPYVSYWIEEFGAVEKSGFKSDLYPPFYNPSSYDLGSRGPDKAYQNWVPLDFKLSSTSGYSSYSSEGAQYIFGQNKGDGTYYLFFELPSEDMKLLDYDNDNINNFNTNSN